MTPILRYDPLGRLIRTDLPNGTHFRVTLTPWQQASWDGNDTVLETGNPWYAARQPSATPTPSAQEQRAAELTEEHAGTPALVHFDVLGRPVRGGEDNGGPEPYVTKAVLDIEGNPRVIVDARGNTAMEYVFDMLGRTLYQKSCDSGERWTLANVLGNPIRGWDGRGHVVRSVYDALNRRTGLWVQKGSDPEVLAEVTVYGEGQTDPEDANLRGRVYQVKDGAGVVTSVEYDFKGNLLESLRQLAQNYSTQLDWSGTVALETEVFAQTTAYDALNRPTSMTTPDQSEIKPTYSEASLLEKVEARIRGASSWTTFVDDIDYDATGQREKIVYGNGVVTEYGYDPLTYRLTRLKTTRTSDNTLLQNLRYTYDPVGNIVEIADLAQDDLYHNSELVEPVWRYEYDAIYRLIEATGREHSGQNSDIQQDANGFPLVNGASPNDPQAMRNYAESFEYDTVGNILKMIHSAQGSTGSWTRRYDIAPTGNRLLRTSLPGDAVGQYSATYTYDEHGSMTSMPHLDGIEWDFKDQKREVDKGGGGTVYFTYDAGGQRVRKIWEHSGIVEERLYLGGFEVYRRHESGNVVLERETLHVMDDARRIAMVETKTVDTNAPPFTPTPRLRYQFGNHLGSASLELDEAGLAISYEEYHPYGTTAYHAAASGVEVSLKRYRYTGKERDEETGLYYHGARYYAPWLGRWTAADPAGMVDGPGLYTYVKGNPVRLSDPSGRASATDTQIAQMTDVQLHRHLKGLSPEARWAFTASATGEFKDRAWATLKRGDLETIRMGVTTVEHVRRPESQACAGCHSTPDGAPAPRGRYFVAGGQVWDEMAFGASSDLGIIEGIKATWNRGDTVDKAELAATGVGTAGGAIPYAGDYISLWSSAFIFGAKPSWSAAGDVGLDAIGAILPFAPAFGTARRAGALADAARDVARGADAAREGGKLLSPKEFEALAEATFGGEVGRLPLSKPRSSGVTDVEIDLISGDTLTQIKRVTSPNATFGGKMREQFQMTVEAAQLSERTKIRYVVANETPDSFVEAIRAMPLPDGMQLIIERLPATR